MKDQTMLKNQKIGVIGVGKLGEAIISGLIKTDPDLKSNIWGSAKSSQTLDKISAKYNISTTLSNEQLVQNCQIIILAIKPQNMDLVLTEITKSVTPDKLIISVAAGVNTSFIAQRLATKNNIVRAMPNTPSIINCGMTAISAISGLDKSKLELTCQIFDCVGKTVIIDENLMDGVTALSASGPAYLYVVIESLAEAGVKLGISRDVATLLAAQTMLGAASMVLESKSHPAMLKDMVTTPAGCTIDGLMELEEGKLRVTLIKAVVLAAKRASELVAK